MILMDDTSIKILWLLFCGPDLCGFFFPLQQTGAMCPFLLHLWQVASAKWQLRASWLPHPHLKHVLFGVALFSPCEFFGGMESFLTVASVPFRAFEFFFLFFFLFFIWAEVFKWKLLTTSWRTWHQMGQLVCRRPLAFCAVCMGKSDLPVSYSLYPFANELL